MEACCHNFNLELAGNLTLSRPLVGPSMVFSRWFLSHATEV
jgi:hypothetical protein